MAKPNKKYGRANCVWTDEELKTLRWSWGYASLKVLSHRLDRSPHSIRKKAADLGLGLPSDRGMSLAEFSKYSGFSNWKIRQAAEKLGETLPTAYSADPGRGNTGKANKYAIDVDLQDKLLKVMLENELIFSDHKGAGKSTGGKWGVGRKPDACIECGTSERPHFAKGKCRSCYNRQFKKKRKKNG